MFSRARIDNAGSVSATAPFISGVICKARLLPFGWFEDVAG